MAVADGLTKAELQPLGELAHLILGHARHDHQTELTVRIQGVDVVVLKKHPYAVLQKLLRVLNAVQGGTGKAGDLLCDDKIEASGPGVGDHPQETLPPGGARPADALVDVSLHIGPAGPGLDEIRVVLHLVFEAPFLFCFLGGDPGVKGHSQGQVKKTLSLPQLPPDLKKIQNRAPPLEDGRICLPAEAGLRSGLHLRRRCREPGRSVPDPGGGAVKLPPAPAARSSKPSPLFQGMRTNSGKDQTAQGKVPAKLPVFRTEWDGERSDVSKQGLSLGKNGNNLLNGIFPCCKTCKI